MSKYKARKTTIDGQTFDSLIEAKYYIYLKEKQSRGEIQGFKCQPVFLLQEAFKKDGQTFRRIDYKADFEVTYPDNSIEIIDVKGMETEAFKIKRKLFEHKYPYKLTLIKYVKKFGGWITVDEWKRMKKEEKKNGK